MDFTREDVIRHLADLGYTNVEEAKLDSFCADLKRLIKYEEKKRRVTVKLDELERRQEKLHESREVRCESSTSPEVVRRKRRVRREDKRRAKEDMLRAKCGSTEEESLSINLEGKEAIASHASESEKSNNSDKVDLGRRMNETADLSEYTHDPSSLYIDVDLPPSRPSSAPTNTLAASLLCHPKGGAGFIRVRSGPSVGKRGPESDPVSLHQKYREQWARVPIPGERRHDRLRWAVRGWMMGEEPL